MAVCMVVCVFYGRMAVCVIYGYMCEVHSFVEVLLGHSYGCVWLYVCECLAFYGLVWSYVYVCMVMCVFYGHVSMVIWLYVYSMAV